MLALLLSSALLAQTPDYPAQLDRWLTTLAMQRLEARAAKLAELKTKAAIEARGKQSREKMLAEIGGLPAVRTPLNPQVTGTFERAGYRVENIVFESQPGFRVTGNLYLPTGARGRVPAVIGVAGHSNNGKASATYQHAWIGFVNRGIAVFAIDPPGQGERSEYLDPATGKSRTGPGTAEHTMAGLQTLLTGQAIARYFIWDGMRALDYLMTRLEIDPNRIAVAGNSGGGTQAAYLAALEPSLAAIVSSCYMTSWRELWSNPGPQDAEQVFPGFLRDELDFGDFMLASNLKPYLMTTAIRDFFPIAGARATYQETLRLYERAGVSQAAGYFEFDDTHGWSKPRREAAYRWLDKWFLNKTSDGAEGEIETEPESLLYATPTGQLATSLGSKTIQELNAAYARTLKRAAPTRESLGKFLALAPVRDEEPVTAADRLEFTSEGGVRFPATLHRPGGTPKTPAILYVHGAGRQAGAAEIADFVRAGHLVLAVDPRGLGETIVRRPGGGYTPAYQLGARAWLLGRSIAAMQVEDLRQAARYLKRQGAGEVALIAKGSAGPAALLAAALEPAAIARVALEQSILSYTAAVEAKLHDGLVNTVIPGILRETDLPELKPLFAGRRVWLLSPVTPMGAPVLAKDAATVYPWAEVRERAEGHATEKVWRQFLAN